MNSWLKERRPGIAMSLAVLAQAIGLILLSGVDGRAAIEVAVAGGALGLAVAETWHVRMRLNHRIDMLLVMMSYGGLGMLIGSWIDSLVAGPHAHHHPASPWAMIPTFMTGMMLLAAVPASVKLTRCAELARTGWRRWVSTHLVGNGLMVLAMVLFGHWFAPAFGALTGSLRIGHHLAMVLGMLIGMELGMFAGEALLGLRPWREWRWGEDWQATLASARKQVSRREA